MRLFAATLASIAVIKSAYAQFSSSYSAEPSAGASIDSGLPTASSTPALSSSESTQSTTGPNSASTSLPASSADLLSSSGSVSSLPATTVIDGVTWVISASPVSIDFPITITGSLPSLELFGGSASTSSQPISTSALCMFIADPDGGAGGDHCDCGLAGNQPVASSTGTNTGADYSPCPYTTITSAASSTTTNTRQYQFTETYPDGEVVEYETYITSNVGYGVFTIGEGGSAILATAFAVPTLSVQVGKSSVHVGTVTGDELYTSVSNALEKICPTATDGALQSCSTDKVIIEGIEYQESQDSHSQFDDGELVVSVLSSSYNSTGMRNALIRAAAQTANTTSLNTGGSSCQETWWEEIIKCAPGNHECEQGENNITATFCNAAPFAGAQYYDGSGKVFYIDALWEFEKYSGGSFDCEEALQLMTDILFFIAPELAAEAEVFIAENEVLATCDDILGLAGED